MLEILLVEDDILSAVDLQMMLEEIYESIEVVHRITAREAKDYLLENTPDVLLIDVVLETEKAGIQLVANLAENKPAVIFFTAFRREDLFQKVLDVDPDSFLQKPITTDRLRHAIELALARKRKQLIEQAIQGGTAVLLRGTDGGLEKVQLKAVVAVEAFGNYCHFHLIDNRRFTERMPIKEYPKRLPVTDFLRIHRGYVINLNLLERIDLKAQQVVVAGRIFPLGKKYKGALLDSYPRS